MTGSLPRRHGARLVLSASPPPRARVGVPALAVALALLALAAPRARAAAAADTLALPDSTLDLGWLERATLARNPTLAARRAVLAATSATARTQGALADPVLSALTAPASWDAGSPETAYRFELSQRLPIFGQGGLERRVATSGAEASAQELAALELDLLRETRTAFYDWFHAARKLDANHEQQALVEHLKDVALTRYGSGLAPQGDVLTAEVDLAMLSHERVLLERDRRVVLARLDALLRLPQGTALPPPPADLDRAAVVVPDDSTAARAARQWPEVRAADLRVEAARRQLDLARRQRWPEPTVSVVQDRYMIEPAWRTSIGLALNLPIDFPRLGDTERAATAGLEAAEADRAALIAAQSERLAVATAALEEARHEVAIMQDEVVPASERALSSLRASYESGNASFTSVLSAARDAARARLDVHRAQASLHQAEAEFLRASAGDRLADVKGPTP